MATKTTPYTEYSTENVCCSGYGGANCGGLQLTIAITTYIYSCIAIHAYICIMYVAMVTHIIYFYG